MNHVKRFIWPILVVLVVCAGCKKNPTVTSVVPADGATEVSVGTDVAIAFDKVIDLLTVTTNTSDTTCSGSLRLSSDSFASCVQMASDPTASNNDQTFTISPAADLASGTTYEFKATTSVQSSEAVALENAFTSRFTTETQEAVVASGVLDADFNSNGYVTHHNAGGGGDFDEGNGMAIDANGNIVVVGSSCDGFGGDMVIWRYTSDGSPDTDFNSTGIVAYVNTTSGQDGGNGVAIDADGNIVVVGYYRNSATSSTDMAIWRYTPDGSPDTDFNSTGFLTHDGAAGTAYEDDYGMAVVIDGNGQIIVVGKSRNGSDSDMIIWRYNAEGTLDNSFNSTGIVKYDSGSGDDLANSVDIDTDGNIVVAGASYNGSDNDMTIWRFTSAGSLDTTFNSTGIATHNSAANEEAFSMNIDASGNIVAAGISNNGSDFDMAIWRYTSEGVLDDTFNSTGFATHDNAAGGTAGNDAAFSVFFDANNNIVLSGLSTGSLGDMAVWRYNQEGNLDTTFNDTGYFTHDNAAGGSGEDWAVAGTIDSSGKIVVTGFSVNGSDKDMAIWRLE